MLVVRILESIISRPLVQKSRESNVPAWFSLPILGCIGNGLLFIFSTSSELVSEADRSSTFWVGPIYVSTGGMSYFNRLYYHLADQTFPYRWDYFLYFFHCERIFLSSCYPRMVHQLLFDLEHTR